MNRWRKVRYTDDGCEIYQCLNCKDTWESRTPADVWSYCPNCGTRWLGQLECRHHEIPRWYFDRYGNRAEWTDMIRLSDGEFRADEVMYRGCYTPPTSQWVFESRSFWKNDGWSEWSHEWAAKKEKLTEAKWALSVMKRERGGPEFFKTEYRVRLEKCK